MQRIDRKQYFRNDWDSKERANDLVHMRKSSYYKHDKWILLYIFICKLRGLEQKNGLDLEQNITY